MRILLLIICLLPIICQAETSKCYGTTSNGSLVDAVKLPQSGNNFIGYSLGANLMGRTYVHSEVKDIVLGAYQSLEAEQPAKVYKYAETGRRTGGEFKPHKTHQNGLSVDFMTPVTNNEGTSLHLPTHALNRLGYDIEFDSSNKYKEYNIDFTALAAHIVQLHKHAREQGHDLWRVIFAPELQPKLYETEYADYLTKHIKFSDKRSWVRHDEHYHVDFSVACEQSN